MPGLCNIFKSIKYVYTISKIFSVLPYKVEISNGEIKVSTDRLSYIFTILTSVVIFGHGLSFPLYVFTYEAHCILCFEDNSTFNYLSTHEYQVIAMKIVNRSLISVMSFSAIFFALFYSAKLPSFLYKIQENDFYFRALLKHSRMGVKCCIPNSISTGLLLFYLPALFYYSYTDISKPDTTATSVWFMLVMMYNNIYAAACDSQFLYFTHLLKVRFQIINNYLTGLKKVERKIIGFPTKLTTGWSVNESLTSRLVSEGEQSLEMCRRCHSRLCDLTSDLEYLYRIVCLTSIGGCFLKVLFVTFDLVTGTTRRYSSGAYEEVLKRVFWINFYAIRFFLIILFACKTVYEGNQTNKIVAELFSSLNDENIEKELVLFYKQLKSRNIEFSAYSLFSLNPELIISAISAGTTYLVVLLQFHTSALQRF